MNLALIADWKLVLKKAWSIKFNILAGALGALEMIVPPDTVPRGAFLVTSILLNTIVIPAVRVLAQEEITNAGQADSNK